MEKNAMEEAGTRIREVIAEEMGVGLETVKMGLIDIYGVFFTWVYGTIKRFIRFILLLWLKYARNARFLIWEKTEKILTVQQAIDAITAKLPWFASGSTYENTTSDRGILFLFFQKICYSGSTPDFQLKGGLSWANLWRWK